MYLSVSMDKSHFPKRLLFFTSQSSPQLLKVLCSKWQSEPKQRKVVEFEAPVPPPHSASFQNITILSRKKNSIVRSCNFHYFELRGNGRSNCNSTMIWWHSAAQRFSNRDSLPTSWESNLRFVCRAWRFRMNSLRRSLPLCTYSCFKPSVNWQNGQNRCSGFGSSDWRGRFLSIKSNTEQSAEVQAINSSPSHNSNTTKWIFSSGFSCITLSIFDAAKCRI